jgi:two-component system chemotaxis response regulator CheY
MTAQDLKVLVCDDSMFARQKMKESLEKFGITKIYEASDGDKAVSKYAETAPDLVFMDIIMPGKTGVEALKEIRLIDDTARVVMASSVGTQGNLKEAIASGAFDFIQKPIDENELFRMLEKVVE